MAEWILKDTRPPEKLAHPATQAAAAALAALEAGGFSPETVLDVGCGSGLLSLSALALWPDAKLVAADISAQAVSDASLNLSQHAAKVLRSDGFSHPELRERGPYDLIVCNLLAELLISFALDLDRALAPGGIAVLSGMLAWQRDAVAAAYGALGFDIREEYACDSWRGRPGKPR